MISRMVQAAKLDSSLYNEVEADTSATGQALTIVLIVAILTGVASFGGGLGTALAGVLLGIAGWALWAWITYFVGTRILPTPETHAGWGQMARVLGFAQSVGILRVVGVLAGLGPFLLLAVAIWQAAAMVIGVREALDYRSVRPCRSSTSPTKNRV